MHTYSRTYSPSSGPPLQPRKWGAPEGGAEALDLSGPAAGTAAVGTDDPAAASACKSRMDAAVAEAYDDAEDAALAAALSGQGGAGAAATNAPPSGLLAGMLSSLKTQILGKEALTAADVAGPVGAMQQQLQARNVSADVAAQVCASVGASLEGTQLASLTRVSAVVRAAMERAIARVLAPRGSHDVLADVRAAQARGQPYSIVFVGVNGVGKSTSLAKIAYWLRQQNLRVMVAACDTFRCAAAPSLGGDFPPIVAPCTQVLAYPEVASAHDLQMQMTCAACCSVQQPYVHAADSFSISDLCMPERRV
jgi:cell wall-associated NlpC family hydrolase